MINVNACPTCISVAAAASVALGGFFATQYLENQSLNENADSGSEGADCGGSVGAAGAEWRRNRRAGSSLDSNFAQPSGATIGIAKAEMALPGMGSGQDRQRVTPLMVQWAQA